MEGQVGPWRTRGCGPAARTPRNLDPREAGWGPTCDCLFACPCSGRSAAERRSRLPADAGGQRESCDRHPIVSSSAVAALGLIGGLAVARWTGRRELGGALFAAAGAWCARRSGHCARPKPRERAPPRAPTCTGARDRPGDRGRRPLWVTPAECARPGAPLPVQRAGCISGPLTSPGELPAPDPR
jgi:hypothetical protein